VDNRKIAVTFFQRKPYKGFNFSLEFIFNDIRTRLFPFVNADVKICSLHNAGFFSIVLNTIQASFRQSRSINHITGEVHFLNLFMRREHVVLTVLDCGMIYRKKGLSRMLINYIYLKLPLKNARIVTVISEHTKNEVLRFTKLSNIDIRIIPVAIDDRITPYHKLFNETVPTILAIGTGYNKNLHRLAEALNGISCNLIIVGKLTEADVLVLNQNKIEYKNYVGLTDEEMHQQYREADIVSFISTYEGFGMPILEGQAVGRVVITSNISSMPEVAGEAACLIDPYSVDSIRNGFIKLIHDEVYRNELIARGFINIKRFDPQLIANKYLEIYKELTQD
jgi:glycosyltransferase involved in cell wall biosynthesis